MRGAFVGALVFALSARSGLAACRNDVIAVVAPQGAQIGTLQAGFFEVLRQELIDPASWAAGQRVEICSYPAVGRLRLFTMTNLARSESLMVTVPGAVAAPPSRRRR